MAKKNKQMKSKEKFQKRDESLVQQPQTQPFKREEQGSVGQVRKNP